MFKNSVLNAPLSFERVIRQLRQCRWVLTFLNLCLQGISIEFVIEYSNVHIHGDKYFANMYKEKALKCLGVILNKAQQRYYQC